jgi:hypothetical protein
VGHSECIRCSPGQYLDHAGAHRCIQCPAGRFASSSGSPECTVCSAGKASFAREQYCEECSAGTLCPEVSGLQVWTMQTAF